MIFEALYIHLFHLLFGPANVYLRRSVCIISVPSVENGCVFLFFRISKKDIDWL